MEIYIHIAGLGFAFWALEHYIMLGTHSRAHRLLPLVLGLIALYDYYEIVQCITGETTTFGLLEDLLIVQMLYLIIHYFQEFMKVKWPLWVEIVMFASLSCANMAIVMSEFGGHNHAIYYNISVVVYTVILGIIVVIVMRRYTYSKKEHTVSKLLYLAVLFPWIALVLRGRTPIPSQILMTIALSISCLIILYLLLTDRFLDASMVLQEDAFQNSDVPMVLLDDDCYFLDSNDRANHLFPSLISDVKKLQMESPHIKRAKAYLEGNDDHMEFTWEERFYKGTMTPVIHNRRLKGYIVSILDITEQKNEIVRANLQREEAQNQTILKSQFMARMSHDLRSPLHAILGISDILINQHDVMSKDRGLLMQIKKSGNTLLEMVNSILDYSKLEAGKMEIKPRVYDLRALLEEVSTNCAINLVNKPIAFSLTMHTDFPQKLYGDENRVKEMFQNIMSNAVKFTEQGEISCHVRCQQKDDNRIYISFSVKDTGPGMNAQQLQSIFTEYVSFADSRTLEGSGLGLCIVNQLATMMGGSTYAESDGISGSVVTVEFYQELPMEKEGDEQDFAPAFTLTQQELLARKTSATEVISSSWVYPDAKILVADDMEVNRQIFVELISRWKCQVTVVENGLLAVEAMRNETFDLVFLDLMMPEMSGVEAIAEIRKESRCPVIALTADSSASVVELKKEGFTDVLWKPIDLRQFKECLEEVLPKNKRQVLAEQIEDESHMPQGVSLSAKRKTLETYVGEVEPLITELPMMLEHDLDTFRIKVHGIKGISRQIGKGSVGYHAEVMEMAAKAGHLDFIRMFMDRFLMILAEVVDDVKEEITLLSYQEQKENLVITEQNGQVEEAEKVDVKATFLQVKEGFETYDLDKIEKGIGLLARCELTVVEQTLLSKVQEAVENFEYEEGLSLFVDK